MKIIFFLKIPLILSLINLVLFIFASFDGFSLVTEVLAYLIFSSYAIAILNGYLAFSLKLRFKWFWVVFIIIGMPVANVFFGFFIWFKKLDI